MGNKSKIIDPLAESFESKEEAGEFWDAQSAMDYAEYLEPVDDVIDIKKRVFEVQVTEDLFQKLQEEATSLHQSGVENS